jgi:alcohol dehydrogenase
MPDDSLEIAALCADWDIPEFVQSFRHIPGGKVVFGAGKLSTIGEEAHNLGATRVLIVTDPGIAQTGAVDRASEYLAERSIAVSIFDDVHENPTTEDVARCVEAAREAEVDLIIGLGGGSSMDTAKGCNFILTNGGRIHDYWGVDKAEKPMLPLIAVPTTSGTGSECQSFALIADAETHAKMACGDKKAAARVSILDPELTLTMPPAVTAHTGIDAIAHALETAVCRKRSEVSFAYSKAAWQLLDRGLEKVMADPGDIHARSLMQLGAAFAGTAIENSMLGVAHSCANPLTAHFGIVHGQAVGTMLPHVIDFNAQAPEAQEAYEQLHAAGGLSGRVRAHLMASRMDLSLSELGVDQSLLGTLSEEAAKQWTAQFNPVEVDEDSLLRLYQDAW